MSEPPADGPAGGERPLKGSTVGRALDNEEYIDGMVALAVPITDPQGRLYATLSFHAPCMRVPFERVTEFLPAVQGAAAELGTLIDD